MIVEAFIDRVPQADQIQVVAREAPPKKPPEVTTSMGWRALRKECARLLDEPSAQPRRGLL